MQDEFTGRKNRSAARTSFDLTVAAKNDLEDLEHDEIRLICNGNGGALPPPLWERAGVRGSGPSIERNPSPGSHLRCNPTSPTRGEVSEPADRPIQLKAIPL